MPSATTIISISSMFLSLCVIITLVVLAAMGKFKDLGSSDVNPEHLDSSQVYEMRGLTLNNGESTPGKITLYNTDDGRLMIADKMGASGLVEEYLLNWNYVRDQSPWFSGNTGNLGDGVVTAVMHGGVLATGDSFYVAFPNSKNLGMTKTQFFDIGAFTVAGVMPYTMTGNIPAVDTEATAAGLNFSMDSVTAADTGLEMILGSGSGATASNYEKFISGTDSGYVDITLFSADWAKFKLAVVGFREQEAFDAGFSVAASDATGDPVYENFSCFGIMKDTIGYGSDIGNTGAITYTDTTDDGVNGENLRIRLNLSSAGLVSAQYVSGSPINAGTLITPTNTPATAYTFTPGLNLIPFLSVLSSAAGGVILVKDIKVVRYNK